MFLQLDIKYFHFWYNFDLIFVHLLYDSYAISKRRKMTLVLKLHHLAVSHLDRYLRTFNFEEKNEIECEQRSVFPKIFRRYNVGCKYVVYIIKYRERYYSTFFIF